MRRAVVISAIPSLLLVSFRFFYWLLLIQCVMVRPNADVNFNVVSMLCMSVLWQCDDVYRRRAKSAI